MRPTTEVVGAVTALGISMKRVIAILLRDHGVWYVRRDGRWIPAPSLSGAIAEASK